MVDRISEIRPKPLFWFRSNTVTDIETRFQEKNPVTNFFHHQRAPKTKFFAKH